MPNPFPADFENGELYSTWAQLLQSLGQIPLPVKILELHPLSKARVLDPSIGGPSVLKNQYPNPEHTLNPLPVVQAQIEATLQNQTVGTRVQQQHSQAVNTSQTPPNPLNTANVFPLKKRKTNTAISASSTPLRARKKQKTYFPSTSSQTAIGTEVGLSELGPALRTQPESQVNLPSFCSAGDSPHPPSLGAAPRGTKWKERARNLRIHIQHREEISRDVMSLLMEESGDVLNLVGNSNPPADCGSRSQPQEK